MFNEYLRVLLCCVHNAMVFQFPEELHTHKTIEGHEEQKEQRHIVDLLTRAPKMRDI